MRMAILMSVAVLAVAYLATTLGRGRGTGGRGDISELLDAIDRGDVQAIRLAVSQGVDVNGRFGEITPLTRAICNGREDVVGTLIRLGADVNAVGPTGRTPLMTAAMKDDSALTETLLAHGATPRADTGMRFTSYIEVARKD